MPSIIIVAGPNGAGKSSFAKALLPKLGRPFTFINADDIERTLELEVQTKSQSELRAARFMLFQINAAIARRDDIMIETTLATRHYAPKISLWRQRGYTVGLVYLRLPSEGDAIARVARRVAAGGHGIPEQVIRRRFAKSLEYLETLYKPTVDEWYVWESIEGDFVPSEAWDMP